MGKPWAQTTSREIYEKLNMLHFSNEVFINGQSKVDVDRVIRSISKNNELIADVLGGYIVVRKVKPIQFDVYLR